MGMRYLLGVMLSTTALWSGCDRSEPAAVETPTPPIVQIDGARVFANRIPTDDPQWQVGSVIEASTNYEVGVVTLVVSHLVDDVAELRVISQSRGRALRGARLYARGVGASTSLTPRIIERRGDRVVLDRGEDGSVWSGDRYVVLGADGRVVGLIEVVTSEASGSVAQILDTAGQIESGQGTRWQPSERSPIGPERLMALVPAGAPWFAPLTSAAAAWPGLEIISADDAPDPDADHDAFRAFGRRHAADVVVAGEAGCDPQACRLPELVAVDGPMIAIVPGGHAADWPISRALHPPMPSGAPPAPQAVADVVFGRLAAHTRRFSLGDWHLRRALQHGAWSASQAPWAHLELAGYGILDGAWGRARTDIGAAASAVDSGIALEVEHMLMQLAHFQNQWAEARSRARTVIKQATAAGEVATASLAHRTLGLASLDPDDAHAHLYAAADVARRVGWDAGYADAMTGLAKRLHEADRVDEAVEILETEVLPLRAAPESARDRAHASTLLALALADQDEVARARAILRAEVIPAHRDRGDRVDEATAQGHLADMLRREGEDEEADRILADEVMPVLEWEATLAIEACWSAQMGIVAIRRGEWGIASARLKTAADAYGISGLVVAEADALGARALAEAAQGFGGTARRIWSRAWPVLEAHGRTKDALMAQLALAELLIVSGRLDGALAMLHGRVLPGYQALRSSVGVGKAWGMIGRAVAADERLEEALRIYLEHEIPAYEAAADETLWVDAQIGVSEVLARMGDLDAAIERRDAVWHLLADREPAIRVDQHIKFAGHLVERGHGDDTARARALLDEAHALTADLEGAWLSKVEEAMTAQGWAPGGE